MSKLDTLDMLDELGREERKKKEMKSIFWVDMEMTGLSIQTEVIIEVAAIITDIHFKELSSYSSVVKQAQRYLDNMDEWNQSHHRQSGLLKEIPHGKSLKTVEEDLIHLGQLYFKNEWIVIAGNSISQDRLFINKYLPRFAKMLHYRILDVSSWKVLIENKYHIEIEKRNSHRALTDIRESIREMEAYCHHFEKGVGSPQAPSN